MQISIGHLYPQSMSTYGDTGNIICLRKRCEWRNIEVVVHALEVGVAIPESIDLYFFGGGQDAAQGFLEEDLLAKKGDRLKQDIGKGVPLLAICGGYQLLGRSYKPFDQPAIQGVGLFPVETAASSDRMIGNLIIETDPCLGFPPEENTVVGFENHSGKTQILNQEEARPLGRVRAGFGNNGQDHTEGCIIQAAIGCYLHGSVLPKNPRLADWLLLQAVQRQDPTFQLTPLEDSLERQAHQYIIGRYS